MLAKYRYPLDANNAYAISLEAGTVANGNNVSFYQFRSSQINRLVSKETIKTVFKVE